MESKILILLILSIKLIHCLKPSQLCFIQEDSCAINYKTCLKHICPNGFSFDSGIGLCAMNSKTYKEFSMWSFVLRQAKHLKFINSKDLDTFQQFTIEIPNCLSKLDYTFRSENFCVNSKNCTDKSKIAMSIRTMFLYKKKKCSCPVKKRFLCGDYCTIDEQSCVYTHMKNVFNSTGIKKCL